MELRELEGAGGALAVESAEKIAERRRTKPPRELHHPIADTKAAAGAANS